MYWSSRIRARGGRYSCMNTQGGATGTCETRPRSRFRRVAPIQPSVTAAFYLHSRRDSDCRMCELIPSGDETCNAFNSYYRQWLTAADSLILLPQIPEVSTLNRKPHIVYSIEWYTEQFLNVFIVYLYGYAL